MSIEHSQNMACFLQCFITFFFGRSGPGPLGPVRKILVVRSGPGGPQFARSVGTLIPMLLLYSESVPAHCGIEVDLKTAPSQNGSILCDLEQLY